MVVMRFLLTPYNRYSDEQSDAFWLMFWVDTDKFTTEDEFWKGEYGKYLKHAREHPTDNFPYCTHVINEKLCPLPAEKDLGDIEDIIASKTQACTTHLTSVRRNLFKPMNSSFNKKVLSPSYYSRNLQ